MTNEIKKQFIAGARCPECGAMDKVQRWIETSGEVLLFCIACEHKEKLKEKLKEKKAFTRIL